MKNQPKHFTPEERVAAEDQIVDFEQCWPEQTEIRIWKFIERRRRMKQYQARRQQAGGRRDLAELGVGCGGSIPV